MSEVVIGAPVGIAPNDGQVEVDDASLLLFVFAELVGCIFESIAIFFALLAVSNHAGKAEEDVCQYDAERGFY